MGRLIDVDKAISDYAYYGISHPYDACDLEDILAECSTVEAIPKDQYEARLKADMMAMLEELDLMIDEIPIVTRHGMTGTVMTAQGMRKKIKENIQKKINALKGEQEQ